MLASAGQPSLHGFDACMVLLDSGEHFGEFAGKNMVRPLFLLIWFFCLVGTLGKGFGVCFFWHLWTRHPGPPSMLAMLV